MLAAGQEALARGFASKAPHTEKFREVALQPSATGCRSSTAPSSGSPARCASSIRGGDHEIAVGDVLAVGADGGDPLVFLGGAYRPLD